MSSKNPISFAFSVLFEIAAVVVRRRTNEDLINWFATAHSVQPSMGVHEIKEHAKISLFK